MLTLTTVVPARGGAEVALGLCYKTFFIYRTCMRRAPARPLRACFVPTCCAAVVQEHDLRATRRNATPSEHFHHTSHCTLHTPHSTLHTCTSHSTLRLISSHLSSSHLSSSHLISCLLNMYYSVLQSLHKALPSTTVYCPAAKDIKRQ